MLWQKLCHGDENCSNAKKSQKHVDYLQEVHIIIYSCPIVDPFSRASLV